MSKSLKFYKDPSFRLGDIQLLVEVEVDELKILKLKYDSKWMLPKCNFFGDLMTYQNFEELPLHD